MHNPYGRRVHKLFCLFTEGFDTADLKDARALLDELSIDHGYGCEIGI
jgi:hypothetical protein